MNIWKRASLFPFLRYVAVLISFVSFFSGCTPKTNSTEDKNKPAGAPVIRSAPTPGAITPEVNAVAGESKTLHEIRTSGILRASIDCSRPPLCFKDSFGVARGFEVDLLRQTAAALSVKLNIVPQNQSAPVSGPFKPAISNGNNELITYYYSSKTGWLAFRINGDPGFRAAFNMILEHFYDTGTFQQLFLNRLQQPEASVIKAGRK